MNGTPSPSTSPEELVPQGISHRTAVVTGSGSGLGNAVCHMLIDAGSHVLAVDMDEQGQAELAREYNGNDRLRTVTRDVRERDEIKSCRAEMLEQWPRPDLVVINAGVFKPDTFDIDDDINWDDLFDSTGRSVVNSVRVFLPDLLAAADAGKAADLIVIGAIASEADYTDSSVFAAAAAAIGRFMNGVRSRFQQRGLRVAHISPGYVDTPETQAVSSDSAEGNEKAEALRPKDVSDVVRYVLLQPPDTSISEVVLLTTTPPWEQQS